METKIHKRVIPFSMVYNFGYYISYPPYKESRPRDLGRTRKEVGKVYAQLFFSFPCSLIFTMVTPLYFSHIYHFTPRDMSQSIKNFDRILSISQIILNTKILHW
jgi:hypothetical protein